MAIAITALSSIASGVDADSYATAAFTPGASRLLVACYDAVKNGAPPTPTVTGHDSGTAWALITSIEWDNVAAARYKLFLFACRTGSSPSSATVTFDHGASAAMTGAAGSIYEVTGADEVNGLTQTFVQTVVSAANLAAATSLSLTLAAAGHADNRPFSCFVHESAQVKTPRASWTEIHDVSHSSPLHALETQWRSDAHETTASASWASSVLHGGMAFEVKALVGGGGGSPPKKMLLLGAG